jgi:hypothetical protein
MVFPQGKFSIEAMEVLKACNFLAAVNTVSHPFGCSAALTLGDISQPAVLRYCGFPLFLRCYASQAKREEVAVNLFFGKPVLLVEHHDVFRRPEALVEAVAMVNSVAPEVRWRNLEAAVMKATLRRRTPDGAYHIRSYSGAVSVANRGDSPERVCVEWACSGGLPSVEKVLQNGAPCDAVGIDDSTLRVLVELPPRSSQALSVVYRNNCTSLDELGCRWKAKAFVRRRLAEVRDNYISKNQRALSLAKALQRRVLREGGAESTR